MKMVDPIVASQYRLLQPWQQLKKGRPSCRRWAWGGVQHEKLAGWVRGTYLTCHFAWWERKTIHWTKLLRKLGLWQCGPRQFDTKSKICRCEKSPRGWIHTWQNCVHINLPEMNITKMWIKLLRNSHHSSNIRNIFQQSVYICNQYGDSISMASCSYSKRHKKNM